MSHIKAKLKEWNKLHFKNIFSEIKKIEIELRALNEVSIVNGIRDEEFRKEQNLKAEQEKILVREEQFEKHKSRDLWLKEGDKK